MDIDVSMFGKLGNYLADLNRERAVFILPIEDDIFEEISLMYKHKIFTCFRHDFISYNIPGFKKIIAFFDLKY